MRILITGANGFLGKELCHYFKDSDITLLSRHHPPYIDLLKKDSLSNFFKNNKFDYVFHTAITGGKRGIPDKIDVLVNNLVMFQNLTSFKDKYKYMFNFCSGAALRNETGFVEKASEEFLTKVTPQDYYGLSKNLISREILKIDNIINFRLFGCFGIFEEESRFFKNIFKNIKNNKEIIIHQNRKMDFISAKDVCKILKFYMKNDIDELPKDLNLVYPEKKTLLDLVLIAKSLTNSQIAYNILDSKDGPPYTGNGNKLHDLKIPLDGLEKSLEEFRNNVFGN